MELMELQAARVVEDILDPDVLCSTGRNPSHQY